MQTLRPYIVLAAVLATTLVLVAAYGAAPVASSPPPAGPGTPAATAAPTPTPAPVAQVAGCTPAPCANYAGATMAALLANDNLQPGQYDQPAASGTYFVQVNIALNNTNGSATLGLNPFDFQLQDPSGAQKGTTYLSVGACQVWQAENVAPGGNVGPLSMCFNPSGNPGDKLILIWNPSFIGNPTPIPLN